MQIWITALIPSLVTIGSSIYINRKNSKYNSGLDKQITIFKNELEKKNSELKSELSKQEARFKNELEKQKKIAEIYYEERAKVLQELYVLLVNLPSDCVNLMWFLENVANRNKFSNPQVYHELFWELNDNDNKLKKALLNSSLYLKDEDYRTIKNFRDFWGEPVKTIVDLFTLYKKTLNDNSKIKYDTDVFREFSDKALRDYNLDLMNKKYSEASESFGQIANILKKAIASEDIL